MPARVSRSQTGPWILGPVRVVAKPPCVARHWSSSPAPGVWTRSTKAAFASPEARIITPALAEALVFVWLVTRAVIVPLPLRDWSMNENWSALPPISTPLPMTVKTPLL